MSTVDERLMAAGSFTLDLDPGTPERIKGLSDEAFMQVVVTGCRVDADALSVADLLGLARYSGVYRKRSRDRCRWEGAGLAVMLGDEDGKGNTYTGPLTPAARPLYDGGTNTSVIRNNVLRAGGGGVNGLSAGTIPSASTPTKEINIEAGDSPRDVLDFACDVFTTSGSNPYEWRINPDGTLDVNVRNTLFPTTATPTCLATRDTFALGVQSSSVDLLPVTRFEQVDDWEDWSSEVVAVGPTVTVFGSEYTFSGTATIGSNPYDDVAGGELDMRRVVTVNKSTSNSQNASIATRKLGRFDDVDRRPSLSTDLFDPGDVCRPGDSIWLFDADTACYSLSTQVDGGAGLVFPLAVRVQGMSWPIRDGMGVYAVVGGSSGTATDLSDWVVFDEGDARLDLGEPRRQLSPRLPRWLPA